MSLSLIDLTSALRPSLQPNEALLFVQDAVGLYQGKAKLAEYQNGQIYLTTHRACYVDNAAPRERCVAVDLKLVERAELYAGFLKSSPKVTLLPKAPKLGLTAGQTTVASGSPRYASSVPVRSSNATWICPICSFSNPIPTYFDPATADYSTQIPACLTCGIKPPLVHMLKASIANISNRRAPESSADKDNRDSEDSVTTSSDSTFQCPRCTFQNHPSLLSCEVCGASLVSRQSRTSQLNSANGSRAESPAPIRAAESPTSESREAIKFSFRAGGEKIFHERLKSALQQRKWLSQSAPPIPTRDGPAGSTPSHADRTIGLAGLERRGLEMRKNNEMVIGNAFEDLEALMTSAKDIIALAETFATHTKNGSDASLPTSSGSSEDPAILLSQLNLTTTKDMLSRPSTSSNNSLYLTELSRSLAEYLTDDVKGILRSEGGITSLVDLWAVFNRARGGVELVSPTDFVAAAELFDKLNLPVRLRTFKSGLLAVQERNQTDEKTTVALLGWIRLFKEVPPEDDVPWDWRLYGKGVTAQDTAERFGWSVGVAEEELEMAEERGALCRDSSLEGLFFWENKLLTDS